MSKSYKYLFIVVIAGVSLLLIGLALSSSQSHGSKALAFAATAPISTSLTPIGPRSTPLAGLLTAAAATAKVTDLAPGIPAIKVNAAGLNLNVTTLTTNLTTILFSEAEVRKYITDHHVMGIVADNSQMNINNVQFIPVKTVNAILNDHNTGLPLEKVVCFVTVSGNFKAMGAPTTFSKAYVLFDAATGNFIQSGEMQ